MWFEQEKRKLIRTEFSTLHLQHSVMGPFDVFWTTLCAPMIHRLQGF